MTIAEIYKIIEEFGTLVFSTIYNDEVHSRVAHFNGFDEDGIYFRTMKNKSYWRQLQETKKVTVCGQWTSDKTVSKDENGMAIFKPGKTIRLIGEIRQVPEEVMRTKINNHPEIEMAVKDMDRYPAMKEGHFVVYKAKVEIFDYDYEMETRDHKVLRTKTSFGGMTFNPAGPIITDRCVGCNKCFSVCTFKAISKGTPYKIISERCEDCCDCLTACPVKAIEPSLTF